MGVKNGVKKVGIVIPTYNEAENITSLLTLIKKYVSNIKGYHFLVVVIDDDSADGTIKLVRDTSIKLGSERFKIVALNQKKKTSYGTACVKGIDFLLRQNVDYILTMDADLSHNPRYIPWFIKLSSDNDLVVGSRYIDSGGIPDWSWYRKMLSKYGNLYAKMILDSRITDYTGGYNLFSAALIKRLNLKKVTSSGYGFLIEIKFRAAIITDSIAETPIVFMDRTHGKSKLPKSTLFNNLLLVPKLRVMIKNSNSFGK